MNVCVNEYKLARFLKKDMINFDFNWDNKDVAPIFVFLNHLDNLNLVCFQHACYI